MGTLVPVAKVLLIMSDTVGGGGLYREGGALIKRDIPFSGFKYIQILNSQDEIYEIVGKSLI